MARARRLDIVLEPDGPALGISGQALVGPVAGEVHGRVPLPVLPLAADLAQFRKADALGDGPERRARPDGLQLLGIAHQNDFRARPVGLG